MSIICCGWEAAFPMVRAKLRGVGRLARIRKVEIVNYIDLSDQGHEEPVPTKVLAILFLNEKELYAVTTILDGAPWFGLVHEDSDALISLEPER
jgi:hypothetical protein